MKPNVVDETPVSAPDARHYFLLSCQKKVSKENARPLRRPATPGALRCSAATGGLRNSGLRPSDSPRPFFPLRLALLDDAKGKLKTDRKAAANGITSRSRFRSVCFSSPSCSAEQRRRAGGSRRGLSEGQSPEFRSRPARRVAQGTRRSRARNAGVAFFLVTFFLARQEKVTRRQGGTKRFRILPQHPPSKRPGK